MSATQLLRDEHQRIRQLLDRINTGLAENAGLPMVVALVTELVAVLRLHERREEDVLFTELGQMGPVMLVVQEHTRLSGLLSELATALAAAQATPSPAVAAQLKEAVSKVAYCLSGHFMKEEQLVFRMAEATLDAAKLARMAEQMTAIH